MNKKKLEEAEKEPVKAEVFTRLFFRHWDEYVEDKRQHLFVISSEGGEPRDITPGNRDAYPRRRPLVRATISPLAGQQASRLHGRAGSR